MNFLCFIPPQEALTSVDSFKDAVQKHKGMQHAYLDDLQEIYKEDPQEWSNAFAHYHDLISEYPKSQIAIALSSNGFWIDDLTYILLNNNIQYKTPTP